MSDSDFLANFAMFMFVVYPATCMAVWFLLTEWDTDVELNGKQEVTLAVIWPITLIVLLPVLFVKIFQFLFASNGIACAWAGAIGDIYRKAVR